MFRSLRIGMTRSLGAAVLALVLVVASVGAGRRVAAGENGPRQPEYLIKAAYLYNFALFVDWPADAFATPDDPFIVGIVGPDPFGWAIDRTVEDKRINRRRIVIQRLQPTDDLRRCQMLFIGDAGALGADIAKRLGGLPILIVDDARSGTAPGGVVAFTVKDDKVGFEIDLQAAKRAGLKISSKMLSLARAVHGS
jgi:hypothetical protein